MKKLIYTYTPLNGMIIKHYDYDILFTNIVDMNRIKWYIIDSSIVQGIDPDKVYKFSLEAGLRIMDDTDPKFQRSHLEDISIISEKITMYNRLNDLKNTLMLKTSVRPRLFDEVFSGLLKDEIAGSSTNNKLLEALADRSECSIDDILEREKLKEAEIKSFFCYMIQIEKEISILIEEERFDEAREQIRTSFETMRL